MSFCSRRWMALAATAGIVAATAVGTPADARREPPRPTEDKAHYILPPGNYGGLPTTDESRDQLPLYDGLTPLRGDVTEADIDQHFIPEDLEPVGATRRSPPGGRGSPSSTTSTASPTSTVRPATTSRSGPAG